MIPTTKQIEEFAMKTLITDKLLNQKADEKIAAIVQAQIINAMSEYLVINRRMIAGPPKVDWERDVSLRGTEYLYSAPAVENGDPRALAAKLAHDKAKVIRAINKLSLWKIFKIKILRREPLVSIEYKGYHI